MEFRNADATTKSASFRLRAFALPPRSELTKERTGPRSDCSLRTRAFYVFREGRLLAHGTWLGLRSVEPHFNLSRIEFSFDHQLDDAFQIDIKKSRIQLQRDLQDEPASTSCSRRSQKQKHAIAKTSARLRSPRKETSTQQPTRSLVRIETVWSRQP